METPSPTMMTSYDEVEDMFDEQPHSFTEIYSQLYLKKKNDHDHDHDSSCSSSPFTLSPTSSLSSDLSHPSLFGFDDDEVKNEINHEEESYYYGKRSRKSLHGRFPPPIPCIGVSGKPLVSLKKIRHDGRFILVEVVSPSHDFIHAKRENGCLKMHFVHSESESESEKDKDEDGGEREVGREV